MWSKLSYLKTENLFETSEAPDNTIAFMMISLPDEDHIKTRPDLILMLTRLERNHSCSLIHMFFYDKNIFLNGFVSKRQNNEDR